MPWENSSKSQTLYQHNADESVLQTIPHYCLPDGIQNSSKSYSRKNLLLADIYKALQLELFTLYFPTIEVAPFFYCCRYYVNNFTIPSLAHSLSFTELIQKMEENSLFFSQICIVIQSNFQLQNFFFSFLEWITEVEFIGSKKLPVIEKFFNKEEILPENSKIFNEHRFIVQSFLQSCFQIENPTQINFSQHPYPNFEWKKEDNLEEDIPMICSCLSHLITTLNPANFLTLWSALLLEYHIVIYGTNIQKVSSIVLALNYLLIPLKWSFSSVSFLPKDQYDYLDSPTPFIFWN